MVPATVITLSLQQRLRSRQDQPIGERLLRARHIVGFARRDYSNDKFRELMGEGVRESGELVGRKEEWATMAAASAHQSRIGGLFSRGELNTETPGEATRGLLL